MRALIDTPHEAYLGDRNAAVPCVVGSMPAADSGVHTVALVRTHAGTNLAASRTAQALSCLPTATHVIMVGIAAGLPDPSDVNEHVRLGDVVISDRVIQHDLVKVSSSGRLEHRPNPRPSSARLVDAAHRLVEAQLRLERPWAPHTARVLAHLSWQRPPASSDLLFDPAYPGAQVPPPRDPVRKVGEPRLFLAPIVSGNALMKNAKRRNELRDRFGALALEMEGAGVADASWLAERQHIVVRGICDYADMNKADEWHEYAAAAAAGVVQALLERVPSPTTRVRAERQQVKGASSDVRRLTVAAYCQLDRADVIDPYTGSLRGKVLGRVNFCPKPCRDDHLHVLWTTDGAIVRACVSRQWPGVADWTAQDPELTADLRRACEVHILLEGLQNRRPQRIDRDRVGVTVPGHPHKLRYRLPTSRSGEDVTVRDWLDWADSPNTIQSQFRRDCRLVERVWSGRTRSLRGSRLM